MIRVTHDGRATGEREIVPAEAEAVWRIFRDYSVGMSPKAIAKRLNAERCPGPGGAPWNPSTIHGNPARGTGMLNNELYEAIVDGVKGSELKDRMADLQDRKDALLKQLEVADEPPAAPASEHGRPLPQQGRGTRVGAIWHSVGLRHRPGLRVQW